MIGIDLVEIKRVQQAAERDSFLRGVFSQCELEYYQKTGCRAETLAGFFAAKEAAVKAFGALLPAVTPLDFEIRHNENGKPVLCGRVALPRDVSVELSITHDGAYAAAVCVLARADADIELLRADVAELKSRLNEITGGKE